MFEIVGTQKVVDNLRGAGLIIGDAGHGTIILASDIMKKKLVENVSLLDHSLEDLRKLGHPYAKRSRSRRVHSPFWLIHRQTIGLGRAVRKKTFKRKDGSFSEVFIDPGIAPEASYVINGTSKMIARPVVWKTLESVRGEIHQAIYYGISQGLKSQWKVR